MSNNSINLLSNINSSLIHFKKFENSYFSRNSYLFFIDINSKFIINFLFLNISFLYRINKKIYIAFFISIIVI